MEEADILADRKAIMTAGRLRCVGTSLFLKSRFGIGYYLEAEVVHKSLDEASQIILQFLHQYAPGAARHQENTKGSAMAMVAAKRNLLLFQLPISSVQAFAELFRDLDQKKSSLGILEYGVSLSTLEEVFFKLGEEEEQAQHQAEDAAARDEEAPPLSGLEVIAERRSSIFPVMDQNDNSEMIRPTAEDPALRRSVDGGLVSYSYSVQSPKAWNSR